MNEKSSLPFKRETRFKSGMRKLFLDNDYFSQIVTFDVNTTMMLSPIQ